MFKRVTADVLKTTGGKQQPERLSRLQSELMLVSVPPKPQDAEEVRARPSLPNPPAPHNESASRPQSPDLKASASLGGSLAESIKREPTVLSSLVGKHKLSLQWVGWDHFGEVNIERKAEELSVKGNQRSKDSSNYVEIDGKISKFDKLSFTFIGTIVTQVSYADPQRCVREGQFTFAITQNRKYWRLQEMQSPCSSLTDYVDIYFK
jgi:hypothetical protein